MKTITDWNGLDHIQKLKILRDTNADQIVADYKPADLDDSTFRSGIAREIALWQPNQSQGVAKEAGAPPNKEVVLGAWRDLDRSEALLELIDNSIDAWNRRRARYPDKSAPELNIYIDVDSDTGHLSYEDNAGGVPTDKLENLVIPGYSETDALLASIGSYKTGGKKAIFRLATAVNITTRFWNPAETGDSGVAIHLDEKWLTDVDQYRFPYFRLKDGGDIQRGQTRYLMQLRPEPIGTYWYTNPSELDKIAHDIKRVYGLLIARNSNINIYFPKRGKKVAPSIDSVYDFTGANDGNIDIRPQQTSFETLLEYEGRKHPLTIEIVGSDGCESANRMTTKPTDRLTFGPNKYAALHLLLCRWVRLFADPGKQYCYVTLGGTELRDIPSLSFVDTALTSTVWSYEMDAKRFEVATNSATELAKHGITVKVQYATLWSHQRQSDLPHIFFVDLQGVCAWSDYDHRFADLFQNEIIREGDCLLITSHLGHNPGSTAIREHFGGEFSVLGVDDRNELLVRNIFRRAHPTMTLFKALCLNGIQSELALRCFGVVKYRDGSPMGIYGYTISSGKTALASFVGDSFTTFFDVGKGRPCKPELF